MAFFEPHTMTEPEGSDTPATAQRSTSRRLWLLLWAAFGVVVLVTGVVWGPTLWYVYRESKPTLSIPERIGGLTLDTSDRGKSTAEAIRDALSVPVGFTHPVAGVYQDSIATNKSVILMAGDATFFRPHDGISQLFSAITDTEGGVIGARAVDPGPLGGEALCGPTRIDETEMPVCAWADHGAAGLMLFPGHTIDEVGPLMVTLRSAVQKR